MARQLGQALTLQFRNFKIALTLLCDGGIFHAICYPVPIGLAMLSNTLPLTSTKTLHRWRVMEAVSPMDMRTRHVCAENPVGSFGISTSAIQEFDRVARTVKTLSGKIYTLVGEPEESRLGAGAWRKWCNDNGIVAELDVTSEYLIVAPETAITFKRLDVRFRIYEDS